MFRGWNPFPERTFPSESPALPGHGMRQHGLGCRAHHGNTIAALHDPVLQTDDTGGLSFSAVYFCSTIFLVTTPSPVSSLQK